MISSPKEKKKNKKFLDLDMLILKFTHKEK